MSNQANVTFNYSDIVVNAKGRRGRIVRIAQRVAVEWDNGKTSWADRASLTKVSDVDEFADQLGSALGL